MAEALVDLIELGNELGPIPALEAYHWREGVWPRPHNALFDFDATRAGAEWIDEIARRAADHMCAGPLVLAHQDWSVKHFRFGAKGRIRVIYDWDSLSIDYESVAVGGAAKSHTAALHVNRRPWRPRVAEALAFVDDYEAVRGSLGTELRLAIHARIVYMAAYTARCEHALAATGHTAFVTDVRAVLRDFADQLLA